VTAPLHIAFFNRSFYPDTSATSQLLAELCQGLIEEHGCRVTVIAGVPLSAATAPSTRRGVLVSRERYGDIEILRARGTRFSKARFIGRFSNYVTYFLSACYAGLRLDRPDVVMALTDPPIIGLAAYVASRRFRVPFVMSYRDIFPEVARLLEDFQSRTVERVLQAVNRFLVVHTDRNVALGETMRRRLIEGKGAPPATTVVIADWADCGEIVPGPRDNRFAAAHGLTAKFVVMHSGNIGLSQGLETLIHAAARFEDVRDLELVFVGEGVKKPALMALARELGLTNVRFLPYQPKEELTESFATADVFVISLKPGLAGYIVPSKLYGILAAGRPYVAAVDEESEITLITKEFDCGLVAEPAKPDDLAEKILKLYHDPALAGRLGVNARRAALRFDRRALVAAYAELFREVVAERRGSPGRLTRLAKRAFDIALAAAGLLAAAPLCLLIALAIKVDDGGPVFYGQPRVGRFGRRFRSWKFRSMVADADARFGPLQAGVADPRITRVGRWLRATAMDELPQLWSILRGDMSFVGPRALVPEEIEVTGDGRAEPIEAIAGYEVRHRVAPGLTGVAQIYANRDIRRRHKFRYDVLYIRRQTFWLDVRLILLSFWITVRGKWEHRGRKF
jgi:lipopolysaccharide/colanic/teichoic acid biosynthesis glycosyltransferase